MKNLKTVITRTPLRISFFGGGSDIKKFYIKNKGEVISSAINKFIYVTIKNMEKLLTKDLDLIIKNLRI